MVLRFEQIVHQIYTFFSKSTTHAAELREMQRVMNEPKLKLKQAVETRWLSQRAIKATLEEEASEGDATS